MTKDEILEMARQSGAMFDHMTCVERDLFPVLYRFAKLVAEKEREACAKIADKEYQDAKTIEETHYKYSDAPFNPRQFGLNMDLVNQSKYLSFAIRARGKA